MGQPDRKPRDRPIATVFPSGLGYNLPERGDGRDGGVSGQCVSVQRPAGLPAVSLYGTAGGDPSAPPALPPLRSAGRAVCCGGVPSRRGLSHGNAGKGRRGAAAGAHRLWPGDPFSPADAADRRHRLRLGGDGSGPRTVGGAAHSQRPGNFLYECQRENPAAFCVRGLPAADGDFSGGGRPRYPGGVSAGDGVPAGANGGPHRIAGHGQQPAGHRRGTGADGGAPLLFPTAAGASDLHPGGGPAPTAAVLSGAETPAAAGADSIRRRTAAQREKRLGGDRRPPLAGAADRPDRHGTWRRIHRPLGRRREKEL